GTGGRFGQAESGQRTPGHQVGQPALLLLVRAVGEDRRDADADGGLQSDAHGLVHPPDLLDRHTQPGQARFGSAVLLRSGEPEQAELTHRTNGIDGEGVLAVPSGGMRLDLSASEVADDAAELLVLSRQLERHRLPLPFVNGWALTLTLT